MRQGQQNKRIRGRNRKGPNPLTRSYESNGPDVKIRGTALHIAEKYVSLARDAQSLGDRVQAENYLQHAEHYYRIIAAAQAQMPQPQPFYRSDDESDDDIDERPYGMPERNRPREIGQREPAQQGVLPGSEPQPYINGNGSGHAGEAAAPAAAADTGGEQPDVAGDSEEGAQGETPQFRSRRRRSPRGRGRRGEGGEGQPASVAGFAGEEFSGSD